MIPTVGDVVLAPLAVSATDVLLLLVGCVVALAAGALLRIRVLGTDGSRSTLGATYDDATGRVLSAPLLEEEPADPYSEPEPELPDLVRTGIDRFDQGAFDGAIQAVYMFVRLQLAEEFELSTGGTHWDFFDQCTAAGLGDRADDLRALTELYEKAAFGSRESTRAEANRAMSLSAGLTGVTVPTLG